MNSFKVADIKANSYFTDDVSIDNTFLLLPKKKEVTQSMLTALMEWQFYDVYSKGELVSVESNEPQNFFVASERMNTSSTSTENSPVQVTEELSSDITDDFDTEGIISDVSGRDHELDTIKKIDLSVITNEDNKQALVQKLYNEYLSYVFDLYTYYATHKEIDLLALSEKIKEICVFVRDNRRYVLQVVPNQGEDEQHFLISHSLRSTILAITIGIQLRFPSAKLVELGIACLLHEIGMIRLPSQLYLSQHRLSPAEKNLLNAHPIISYTILKGFDMPLNICLAVLEHHEKENGTGYPRHIMGDKISLYAKIISVVCSYDAITAPRSYKEMATSFEAMVELLQNKSKQYDETIIKALLYSLSLFPIGSYVFLSDGKVAKVIDVNPENPKNPVVRIIGKKNGDGVIKTSEEGVKIIRVLNKQELSDLSKAGHID